MDKHRDTQLIWQALALVTQAVKVGVIEVTPEDLEGMQALLKRMADQESTWQLVHQTDDPESRDFAPRMSLVKDGE